MDPKAAAHLKPEFGFIWPSGYLTVKQPNGDAYRIQGLSWKGACEHMATCKPGAIGEYHPAMQQIFQE